MPTRTYVGIDFINYAESFLSNLPTTTGQFASQEAVATPGNNFDVTTTANGSNDQSGNGQQAGLDTDWVYEITGDLDFDAFPAIPENAQIQSIEVQVDVEMSGNAAASFAGASGTASVSIEGHIAIFKGVDILSNLSLDDSESTGVEITSPQQGTIAEADHYSASQLFDFTGSPISKANLIADYTTWRATLSGISFSNAQSFDPGATQHSDCLYSVGIAGIRITVTYVDGPITVSLSPPGGNVEIGQTIVATGPNAAELEYAALQNTLVIPLVPKIISPTEVWLEVPYPASDPCFDCFPECPECDAAFAPCDEDLTGEACQEAIANCLTCLTECLESLALAEACQDSNGNPPDTTTPIVIICGTQFGGSVELGNFTILVANGSGIYRFVTGKTNDTLYVSERDGSTYDVKIPNPGAKTGFFRS